MTAERVNPPRWRRRRGDETQDPLGLHAVEDDGESVSEPVPQPRPPLTSRNPTASGGSWAGRASSHRREQVRARGPIAGPEGPTGPVDARPGRRIAQQEDAVPTRALEDIWSPVVDRLSRELEGLVSVVLCTTDGTPLAAHGLADAEVPVVAQLTGSVFTAGHSLMAARHESDDVETIKLASGRTRTIITTVREPGDGIGLLSVTAEDASVGVMLVQARTASEMLETILAQATPA